MEWYEELDLDENPFSMDTKFFGNDDALKETFYAIISGNILVLEGAEGSGKTKILKEVIRKFGGYGRIAYLNAKEMSRELNVEEVLAKKNGFLGMLFKKYPKNMILLLDDVESLSPKNVERIKYFYDSNHLKAVIIATKSYEKIHFTESFTQRIRKVFALRPLSEFEAVQVVREKIGEQVLSDRVLKETYKLSGRNMQKFLKNCEHVCKVYLAQNKSLNEEDVKRVLERGAQ
ncbi:ATP-binding protein [Candidatus Woesearchaeota archaeon]|nr:ATP-binding protein [Candidatus Woesearchaeota archaeon]